MASNGGVGDQPWLKYKYHAAPPVQDPAVAKVMTRMAKRSEAGMQKYGVAIGDYPGDLRHWLLQLQEELTDAAIYIERALHEIDRKTTSG